MWKQQTCCFSRWLCKSESSSKYLLAKWILKYKVRKLVFLRLPADGSSCLTERLSKQWHYASSCLGRKPHETQLPGTEGLLTSPALTDAELSAREENLHFVTRYSPDPHIWTAGGFEHLLSGPQYHWKTNVRHSTHYEVKGSTDHIHRKQFPYIKHMTETLRIFQIYLFLF